jgi:TPR repeat protein
MGQLHIQRQVDIIINMNSKSLLVLLALAGATLASRADSIEELRRKADDGIAQAQCDLGYTYEKGLGVPQDYALAFQWYRRAADQNLPMGLNNVGSIYSKGLGVPKDDQEAFKWFGKAAELGFAASQNRLGIMFADGLGTGADPVEAYMWFYIAARQGYPPARENVDIIAPVLDAAEKGRAQRAGDEFLNERHATRTEKGAGFFITSDGYILTCHHVIKDAVKITVRAGGAEPLDASLVKADAVNDLALLKVSGRFSPLPLIRSRDVRLGETVFTLGNPNVGLQGISLKLTDGTINSLAGELDCPRLFQVNTAFQPGNSGGPLVDLCGNVIGVFTRSFGAKRFAARNDGAFLHNINYAVKSSYALAFLDSVPELAGKLVDPNDKSKRALENLAPSAQAATVLVSAE